MPNLTPADSFDDVPELATTDLVQGGPGGKSNEQPQKLLNRTHHLRQQQLRERSSPRVLGPGEDFPIALAPNDCLLNLRANETVALTGNILLPSAALCIGKKYFLFITNGTNNTKLIPNGTDTFLNQPSGSCPDPGQYILGTEDGHYQWFTPDGDHWLVSFSYGSDPAIPI
jgi:hypothetical protein